MHGRNIGSGRVSSQGPGQKAKTITTELKRILHNAIVVFKSGSSNEGYEPVFSPFFRMFLTTHSQLLMIFRKKAIFENIVGEKVEKNLETMAAYSAFRTVF